MRLLPVALVASVVFTTLAVPGNAQQRLRKLAEQRQHVRETPTLPTGTRVERDIAYGPHAKQRYDVYLPAKPLPHAPILFMVHGGGWRRGDKGSPGVVGNKAAHWLAQGFVFVSSNNRLLPDADPLAQAGDVAAAVASVQKQATQWGADPQRMILIGHSAGAHLVALLGASPSMLAQAGAARPLGVVALDSGALDVPALMAQPRVPQLYHDAFGADPAYWRSVSPQRQLGRGALPMLLVCSSTRHFPTSPCAEADKLALRGNAVSAQVRVLPEPLAHGEINSQLGLSSAYTRAVSAWIDRLLN